MRSLRFKIIDPSGTHVADCKHAEDAASVVSTYGAGTKVRDRVVNRIVWHEGREMCAAGESYDRVAAIIWNRVDAALEVARKKYEQRYGVQL